MWYHIIGLPITLALLLLHNIIPVEHNNKPSMWVANEFAPFDMHILSIVA